MDTGAMPVEGRGRGQAAFGASLAVDPYRRSLLGGVVDGTGRFPFPGWSTNFFAKPVHAVDQQGDFDAA